MEAILGSGLYLGATGFALIAVCYGFARFAFGLFLPQIETDLALSPTLIGLISGGAFFGYCVTIVRSAYLTERMGARAVAIAAALVAALGMAGIALASSAPWLAAAVMLAGSSTGLVSPPMATAVAMVIRPQRQSATNTIINAGTDAGVVFSGPVALLMGEQWRLAYAGFAIAALGLAWVAAFSLPAGTPHHRRSAGGLPAFSGVLWSLISACFLMGVASTAVWSFGGQLVSQRLNWNGTGVGLLWIAIGAAGIAGAAAGSLIAQFRIDRVHRVFLILLAAGIFLVGAGATTAWTLWGGVLFGAAYIMLTGVYLVWGVTALPDRPALGLMISFLAIAIGQAAGATLFGLLIDVFTPPTAVTIFACLALVAGWARAENGTTRPGRQPW